MTSAMIVTMLDGGPHDGAIAGARLATEMIAPRPTYHVEPAGLDHPAWAIYQYARAEVDGRSVIWRYRYLRTQAFPL